MWYCGDCGHVFDKVVGEGLAADVMAHQQKHAEERGAALDVFRSQAVEVVKRLVAEHGMPDLPKD